MELSRIMKNNCNTGNKDIFLYSIFSKKIWCQTSGWFYVIISILGNLFPLWFKSIIQFIDGKSIVESLSCIKSPPSFLLISISLSSMTIYLWLKNLKLESNKFENNNDILRYALMVIYILIIFPLWGYLINIDEEVLKDTNRYSSIIYMLSFIVAFVYTYFQLKDFSENKRSKEYDNLSIKKEEQREVNDLGEQLNSRLQ